MGKRAKGEVYEETVRNRNGGDVRIGADRMRLVGVVVGRIGLVGVGLRQRLGVERGGIVGQRLGRVRLRKRRGDPRAGQPVAAVFVAPDRARCCFIGRISSLANQLPLPAPQETVLLNEIAVSGYKHMAI